MTDYPKDEEGFISIDTAPIAVHGVFKEGDRYVRMPSDIAKNVSDDVYTLNFRTAGGMVRFRTNSKCVSFRARYSDGCMLMQHMTPLGEFGFDYYEGKTFHGSLFPSIPANDMCADLRPWRNPPKDGFRDLTVYMPLYGSYKEMAVKIDDGAVLLPCTPFRNEKPVVIYGSSITEGACASRPGLAYTNMLSRSLNMNHVNLGFSGSAKGEQAMADYIASLDMTALVMDYDYNSSVEELDARHEPFFKTVRAAHPGLPIVLVTSIVRLDSDDNKKARCEIIRRTYENALAAGDENVYYLCGTDFFRDAPIEECLTDGLHPNDIGMYRMFRGMRETLDHILS